ncbi:MAG: endonuclease/exonuclease/phosphatase family protein [Patescibacteria group bacterium]
MAYHQSFDVLEGTLSTRLTVLTFNAGLLRVRVLGATLNAPVPFVAERLQALPAALASVNADLVALQEIYEEPHRLWLAQELRHKFPYAAWVQDHGIAQVSNGLMTLSRYPLEAPAFELFANAPFGERHLARKGFLSCVVRTLAFGPVRFFNTHTASGGILGYTVNPLHERLRGKQVAQLNRAAKLRQDEAVLVAGDFNAGPESSPGNYREILADGFLDAYAEAKVRRGPLVTWDPQNPLTIDGPHRNAPAQRVDHVFIPLSSSRLFHVENAHIVLDRPTIETDGGPVTPSDHYGLLVHLYRK